MVLLPSPFPPKFQLYNNVSIGADGVGPCCEKLVKKEVSPSQTYGSTETILAMGGQ